MALDLAVDAAKRLDIRVHSKRIDEVLDVALAVGCGALTSFILTDWSGFSAGLVEHAISKKVDLSKKVTGSLLDTPAIGSIRGGSDRATMELREHYFTEEEAEQERRNALDPERRQEYAQAIERQREKWREMEWKIQSGDWP